MSGDTKGSDLFDPSLEWISFAQNTFGGLGSHSVESSAVSIPPTAAIIGLGMLTVGLVRSRRSRKTCNGRVEQDRSATMGFLISAPLIGPISQAPMVKWVVPRVRDCVNRAPFRSGPVDCHLLTRCTH